MFVFIVIGLLIVAFVVTMAVRAAGKKSTYKPSRGTGSRRRSSWASGDGGSSSSCSSGSSSCGGSSSSCGGGGCGGS